MPFDGVDEFDIRSRALARLDRVQSILATEDRWCKRHFRTWNGRYCLVGALMAARAKTILYDVLLMSIWDITGVSFRNIMQFNDAPGTNHQLVLSVLSRARARILAGDFPVRVTIRQPALLQMLDQLGAEQSRSLAGKVDTQ
jgi:hypothetical protein